MIRVLATVIGVLAVAVAAVGLVSRYLSISNEVVLVVAAASPYLSAAGLAAMILFALVRRWVLTIVAALLSLVVVGVQMPRYLGPEKAQRPRCRYGYSPPISVWGKLIPKRSSHWPVTSPTCWSCRR